MSKTGYNARKGGNKGLVEAIGDQCGCCYVGSRKGVQTIRKTFEGASEIVFGELNRFYGEPRGALCELGERIVKGLGFVG